MKKHLLLVIVLLFTSVGYGKEYTAQTSAPVYQPMIENSTPSINLFSSGLDPEMNHIDTTEDKQRALAESKPKRHLFAKAVLGLVGAFVIIVILAFRNGY
jgi:hypothetical protein